LKHDPTDKFGSKFIGYRFFISGRMNHVAGILDAFAQAYLDGAWDLGMIPTFGRSVIRF